MIFRLAHGGFRSPQKSGVRALAAPAMAFVLLLLASTLLGGQAVKAQLQSTAMLPAEQPASNYLTLSYESARAQMKAGDFEAAERTIGWIRKVAPDDPMVGVLQAELQLRHGNIALAVMQLSVIIDAAGSPPEVIEEAALLLRTASLIRNRPLLPLDGVDRMLPADGAAGETPQLASSEKGFGASDYTYEVAILSGSEAGQIRSELLRFSQPSSSAGLAGSATTAEEPADMAGATSPDAAQTPEVVEVAALTSSPPATPQTEPVDLIDRLFADPGNLELNFAVFQQQVAEDDLDGAAATLERVLLIDPRSKLAKVLLADIHLRRGNLILARNTLETLLAEEDTPVDMAARAEGLLAQVEDRMDPLSVRTTLVVETGRTENAFGRSESDEILLLNLPIQNTTPNKSDIYRSYVISFDSTRELNRQTPTLLEAGISVTGRDTRHKDLSDQRTIGANLSLTERAPLTKSAGLFLSSTRVNHRSFNKSAGLFAALQFDLASNWQISSSVSASRSEYVDFAGLADNRGRTGQSYVARLGASRQFDNALINLALSTGRSKARTRTNNMRFKKAEVSVASMLGAFSLTSSVSRQWTRNEVADLFISPLVPKLRQDSATVKIRYPRGSSIGDFYFIPYIRLSSQSTKSNIPNNRREGSEAAFGLETVF